jgi:hypothetical protein
VVLVAPFDGGFAKLLFLEVEKYIITATIIATAIAATIT